MQTIRNISIVVKSAPRRIQAQELGVAYHKAQRVLKGTRFMLLGSSRRRSEARELCNRGDFRVDKEGGGEERRRSTCEEPFEEKTKTLRRSVDQKQ